MAGCCYGIPTDSFLGVIFTSPVCQAEPLNTPLHPTQVYEAIFIFGLMSFLLILKSKKKIRGSDFLLYLVFYAAGRGVLELFRGDIQRGFLIKDILSNSQFIALIVISIAGCFYIRLNRKSKLLNQKK
ncbi:MAG: prolipoprotein diacylglyceryl transferase family protein [Cytophagales bacterium]|nr:prolipoprotein diacylglyceryl transferase family protein [Cytophagales bacterium]